MTPGHTIIQLERPILQLPQEDSNRYSDLVISPQGPIRFLDPPPDRAFEQNGQQFPSIVELVETYSPDHVIEGWAAVQPRKALGLVVRFGVD